MLFWISMLQLNNTRMCHGLIVAMHYYYHLQLSIISLFMLFVLRKVWRKQRGNQKLLIEDGQTMQWPKEKGQITKNDLQNIAQKINIAQHQPHYNRGGGELMCSGRATSSCPTCDAHRLASVTSSVIRYEWGKDQLIHQKGVDHKQSKHLVDTIVLQILSVPAMIMVKLRKYIHVACVGVLVCLAGNKRFTCI